MLRWLCSAVCSVKINLSHITVTSEFSEVNEIITVSHILFYKGSKSIKGSLILRSCCFTMTWNSGFLTYSVMKLKDTLGGYVTSALHQCRQNWSTQKCLSQRNVCCYLLSREFIRVERKIVCLLWLQSSFHLCVQTEGELSSLKVGRVPVVTAGGSSVFLPLSREDQAGQMNPHLPVIILEPSGLVRTPLLTGETCALCTHPQCWGKSSAVHSWKVFILMLFAKLHQH